MLTNIGMGILLTACGNGGMDPVDTGGEDEYVPVDEGRQYLKPGVGRKVF